MKSLLLKLIMLLAVGAVAAIFAGMWFSSAIDGVIPSDYLIDHR
jgi:hypothetical protein